MQQPAHVKSLAETFRGAGYPTSVKRIGGAWELAPSGTSTGRYHLIGLFVRDDGQIVFQGIQECEGACNVGDMTDRDLVTLYVEVDVEGWDALFEVEA